MHRMLRREWNKLAAMSLMTLPFDRSFFSVDQATNKSNKLEQVLGIDHLRIAVRDLEAAKDQYREVLGFSLPPKGQKGIHPTGSENSSAKFADNYLELIAVHDRDKVIRNRPWLIDFLQRREGAQSLGLLVSSAQETVNSLRARGFEVTDPVGGTIMREGDKEPPPPLWWLVDFRQPALPGGVIFLIEYANTNAHGPNQPPPQHPNTCIGIEAAWFVVSDLKQAVETCISIGFLPKRSLELGHLGAIAKELEAAKNFILLVQPVDANGYAESFRKQAGEGIMGVTLRATSLATARTLLQHNAARPFPVYAGPYGESILIAGDLADGLWIEMSERH